MAKKRKRSKNKAAKEGAVRQSAATQSEAGDGAPAQPQAAHDAITEPNAGRTASGKSSASPRTGKRKAHTAAQPPGLLDHALLALVIAGIALTAYLTLTAWFGEHAAFCGADSSCDLVQSSRWSTLLGVPMSLWGLLTYLLLARAIWRLRSRPTAWGFALLVAFVGVGVSWYLTVVSVVQIEATCVYCLASFAIMNVVLLLLLLRRPAHLVQHQWSKALPTPVAVTVAVVLALQLHFSGLFDPAAGPEDPWLKGLAVHLSQRGATFYGAYWCPVCQEQKAMFEASASRLPYVECTPDGRSGAVSLACRDADITSYPTWTIGSRRMTGAIEPKELARLSAYRAP